MGHGQWCQGMVTSTAPLPSLPLLLGPTLLMQDDIRAYVIRPIRIILASKQRICGTGCSLLNLIYLSKRKQTFEISQQQQHSVLRRRQIIQTRNSSGDEIANVNFLYDDIIHALQNIIDSCINSAMHRSTRQEHRFTEFSNKITQCNGHYAVQGHSRSPILVPIESSYTISY